MVYFDDVRFEATAAPPAEGDTDGGQQTRSATVDRSGTATEIADVVGLYRVELTVAMPEEGTYSTTTLMYEEPLYVFAEE